MILLREDEELHDGMSFDAFFNALTRILEQHYGIIIPDKRNILLLSCYDVLETPERSAHLISERRSRP